MKPLPTEQFLTTLPTFLDFADVANASAYRALPEGWALAVADIVDSTGAIGAGRYKAVNMSGAAVISAVLNAAGRMDLPFVFGGDGALVAVPPEHAASAARSLAEVAQWCRRELGLAMRRALVPLANIRDAGHDVKVARFQASPEVAFSMFAGGGSSWAEARMKEGLFAVAEAGPDSIPDLAGLSCRWGPVRSQHGQIASLIVVPGPAADSDRFASVVAGVVKLAAKAERAGHPLPPSATRMSVSMAGVMNESRTQAGRKARAVKTARTLMEIGAIYLGLRTGLKPGGFDARQYASDVVMNSDFRKFDDGLKMTLDIAPAQLDALEAHLKDAAAAGICRYGIHRQDSALVTCIVPSPFTRDHVHFVDGGSGGYAMAAKQLKEALQQA